MGSRLLGPFIRKLGCVLLVLSWWCVGFQSPQTHQGMVSRRNMMKSRFFKWLCGLLKYVNYCECLKFVLTRFDLVWTRCFGVVPAFFRWILVFSILCLRLLCLYDLFVVLCSGLSLVFKMLFLGIVSLLWYLGIVALILFAVSPECLAISCVVFVVL